jgi:hypothetical protein
LARLAARSSDVSSKHETRNAPVGGKMSITPSYAISDDDGAFLSRAVAGSREFRLCLALTAISIV